LSRDDRVVGTVSVPCNLSVEGARGSWRPGILRPQPRFTLAPGGHDRSQGPQGSDSGSDTDRTTDKVRTRCEHQDCERTENPASADDPGAGRRFVRVTGPIRQRVSLPDGQISEIPSSPRMKNIPLFRISKSVYN